jgi:hypothetical protein
MKSLKFPKYSIYVGICSRFDKSPVDFGILLKWRFVEIFEGE